MLTVVLCVLLCVCTIAAMCRGFTRNNHKLPPAYPGALPVIGHSHILMAQANSSRLWRFVQSLAKDAVSQGGVTHLVIANKVYYVIADSEDAWTASNACINKSTAYDLAKAWFGDGLITSSDEIWKRHRRIIHPAFGSPVIHGFINVFNSQAKKLLTEVESQIGQGPFNHLEYLKKNSLETFCLSTFGMNVMDDVSFIQRYMDSVDIGLNMIVRRFQAIWQYSEFLFWLSGLKKKEKEEVTKLTNMSNKILQKRKLEKRNGIKTYDEEIETAGNRSYRSFLDLLLELSADGKLTDKEIEDEMNTIIAAGFETTSNQLMYTLMLLGSSPEVQDKVYQEVLNVLGPERDVEKDDINKLVYTNAVLMESLRLYPAIPVVLRHVDRDVKLKNFTMRAGSECILCPLVDRHDATWGPEGEQFRPERWLKVADLCSKKEFAGFGLGKRACIGRQYAMTTMKVILAHFMRKYKVTADVSQLQLKFDFVLKPTDGHKIKIERRV